MERMVIQMMNNDVNVLDTRKANLDKLISIVNNLTDEELYLLILNGNTILMEKNILCGKCD